MQTHIHNSEPRRAMMARALAAAATGCLVAAGILLWSHRGDAVFSDMVLAALAWCF